MYMRRRPRKPFFVGVSLRPLTRGAKIKVKILVALLLIMTFIIPSSLYLRSIVIEIAVANATDMIVYKVNDAVSELIEENGYGYDYFVTLEKDGSGNITAITTNMAHINAFSSALMKEVVNASDSGELDTKIPIGNLFGSNLLLGKGPEISVDVIMRTSSFAEFKNELSSAGINQTKHALILEVTVDIKLLVPWTTVTTSVSTDVLIAETVIIGQVPETYINME